MLRDTFVAHHSATVDGFRWRSREIARIEGFSDAVFGFAVTLLIVSLEVPQTSTELFETMRGFLSFLATFTTLASIWYAQFLFFRRYGLEDRVTVILNLILLFTVLFFAYPLKFLFGVMLTDPTLLELHVHTHHGLEQAVLREHRPWLFLIFGAGMAAIFTVFALLYWHAYKKRDDLGLNELEIYETRHSIKRQIHSIVIGLTYFALAAVMGLPHATRPQKIIALSADVLVLAVMVAVMIRMLRMNRERKRVRREWAARQGSSVEGVSGDGVS